MAKDRSKVNQRTFTEAHQAQVKRPDPMLTYIAQ